MGGIGNIMRTEGKSKQSLKIRSDDIGGRSRRDGIYAESTNRHHEKETLRKNAQQAADDYFNENKAMQSR